MTNDNILNLQTSSYRRCLRVTLLIFVIQLCSVTHLKAEDRIVIPELQIVPGTIQRLAIQLENEVAYTAFQISFYFPEGISPLKTNGNYSVELSSRKANHAISANLTSDGALKVVSYSMGNLSYSGNSGDLFYIDIVSDPTFTGPVTIVLKGIRITRTSDRKELKFPDTYTIVSAQPYVRGDANCDGSVTIADAVVIANYINGNPSENFNKTAANVNCDFDEHAEPKITISDAVGVVNIIMNNGGSAPKIEAP